MTTAIYSNRKESAVVIMDGECLGCNILAKTCVRKTVDGQFAVITTIGTRLLKVLPEELRARAYNSAIN